MAAENAGYRHEHPVGSSVTFAADELATAGYG
jgi:hypothetical protein